MSDEVRTTSAGETTPQSETMPISEDASTLAVIRRGLQVTPEITDGIGLSALLGIALAAGRIAVPVVIQQAIDRGGLSSGDVNVDVVVQLGLLGIAAVLISESVGIIVMRRLIIRAEAALCRLRVIAFDHVHKMSLQDHNEKSTGVLVSRVTSDVDALTRFADWGLFTWLSQPIVVLGIFVAMGFYSWPLAILGAVCFLPVVWALRWVRERMTAAHDARRSAVGDLLGAFTETINGAEVIRAYRAEDVMSDRLEAVSEHRYRSGIRANIYMSGVYVVGDIFSTVMMMVLLIVGVTQRSALGLTAGELIAILSLAALVQSPVAELGESINNAQQAVAGWRKVLGLLDHPIEVVEPSVGETLPDGALSVGTTALSFAYHDGGRVLREVTVDIPAGARVAVVGATGSGKSTFARMLCRLADPQSGTVQIGGLALDRVSADSRRRSIRFVPQDGFLFDTTIRENIRNGRVGATDHDVDAAVELLGLGSWVSGLANGIDTEVGERGALLSVGERQLVSFARAAVADPGLLILDEATSSVDPQTDIQLTRAIEQLSTGRTVISIAHRLSTAEAADVVLVFDDGELVEQGPHGALVTEGGVYARLHEAWTSSTTD